MPIIMKGLHKTILDEAKKLLLEQGIRGIRTRALAHNCGIAEGTLYNYFESKEAIISEVILMEWAKTVKKVEKGIQDAESGADGMIVIYKSVKPFFDSYYDIFDILKKKPYIREEFHRHLMDGIIDLVESVIGRFPCALQPVPFEFFAGSILQAVTQGSIDPEEFRLVMQRLFE